MKLQLELPNKRIDYVLKISRRARQVRLAVYSDGKVTVTAPKYVSQKFIENFVFSKALWLIKKLDFFKANPRLVVIKCSRLDYEKYKSAASLLVKKRLEHFNKIYGFKYHKISIKNQATRWGSCSRKGNLNFNYKIVLLPKNLADYLIVHELCHLKEFNHERKFWSLVAEAIPDHLELRKQLKGGGMLLF